YTLVGGTRSEVGSILITRRLTIVGPPSVVRASGLDALEELSWADVGELEIAEQATVPAGSVQKVTDGAGSVDLADAYDGETGTSETITLGTSPLDFLYVYGTNRFDVMGFTLAAGNTNAASG